MNRYVELRQTFQFLDCAVRQKDTLTRCPNLPSRLAGRNPESSLRDYVFALMLVASIAQLEFDIETLRDVPGLRATDKLSIRLRILRDHFNIATDVYNHVDRLRDARNQFIHDGELPVDAGFTKSEVPGVIVRFLQRCEHPDYT